MAIAALFTIAAIKGEIIIMTGKSITRMSGMSSKRVGKMATAGLVVSCCNLLWLCFKWMFIVMWFFMKWSFIGAWFCMKWMCIGTIKLCKWSFKAIKAATIRIKSNIENRKEISNL